MSGCFTTIELHPQGPADVADLARAEAHAGQCAACAERLARLRTADSLLAQGLTRASAATPCPEPEALAAWIDAGRPADAEMVEHLSTCVDCRADLLDAVEDEAPPAEAAAPRSSSRRSQRLVARRTRGLEVAVAAAVAALAITWWAAGRPEPRDPKLVASRPAPRLTETLPTPLKVPARPRPVATPGPVVVRSHEPRPEPTAASTRRPAPTPSPTRVATPTPTPRTTPGPTPAPTATATPAPTPTPAESSPTPSASPTATPPVAVAALAISESAGLALKDERGKLQPFKGSELVPGSELVASSRGARLQTGAGMLLLAPRSRLTYSGQLSLTAGKALVEGRDVIVEHALATVQVQGRALIEARKNKLGVSVLFGRARVQGDRGEPAKLTRGGWWAKARSKAARTGQTAIKPGRPPRLPGWARPLHPNPTGGLRGRPGRRGPRGGPNTGGPRRGGGPGAAGGSRTPRTPGGRSRPPSR